MSVKMAIVIFLLLFGIFADGRTYDIPEFQYPCYVDICTFPTQFCNSERFERRCSPCTKAVCRAKKVPLACKYICGLNQETKTTKTTQPPKLLQSADHQSSTTSTTQHSCMTSTILLVYSAVTTTIIIVVMMLFWACRSHRKYKQKHANRARQDPGQVGQDVELKRSLLQMNVQSCENGTVRRLDTNNDGLPSYTTNDIRNVASPADPVQESSPGRTGCHRQVCNTIGTNTAQDEELVRAARPKYNNQQAYQHSVHQQPMSARSVNNTSNVQQNTTSDGRETRSLGGAGNAASNTRDSFEDPERSIASSEETSLKS